MGKLRDLVSWRGKLGEHHQEDLKGQSEMLGLVMRMRRHVRFRDLRETDVIGLTFQMRH